MTDDIKKAIIEAQKRFERDQEKARAARQQAFAKAHERGYSYSEIAAVIGISKSRVEQVIKGR